MIQGWQCPSCGVVLNPSVLTHVCNVAVITTAGTNAPMPCSLCGHEHAQSICPRFMDDFDRKGLS